MSLADYGVHELRIQSANDSSAGVDVALYPHPTAAECLGLDHDELSVTIDGKPLELIQAAREETLPRAGAICHRAIYRSSFPVVGDAILVVEDSSHRITFEVGDRVPVPTATPDQDGPVAPGAALALTWSPTSDRLEINSGHPLTAFSEDGPALSLSPEWQDADTMIMSVPEDALLGSYTIWLDGLCRGVTIRCEGVSLCHDSSQFHLPLPLEVAAAP